MTGTTGRRSTGAGGAGPDAPPRADGHHDLDPAAADHGPDRAGVADPGSDPEVDLPPGWHVGDLVAGVRLTAPVGRGGSGQVWAGTEEPGGDRVAVKLFHRHGAEHEARLLAGLRHPHVLPLRRVVTDPPAVVTDLAEGGSLQAQVAVRGCLGAAEVVTVVAPLADALAFLHGRGVVHGDVSAGNVLFVGRGRPVLADLGSGSLAGAGQVSATPGFVAPEVLAGARPGPAADVHGLGAVAWLALTGGVPPAAADRLPLRLLAPDCPDGLVEVVTAALDPDPAARPSPEDLAGAARASCVPEAVRLVPAAALGVPPEEAVTFRVREAARQQGGGSPAGRPSRRAVITVSASVAAVASVAAALAVVLPGRPGPADEGPPGAADRSPAAAVAATQAAPDGPQAEPGPLGGEELGTQVRALVLARQEALGAGDVTALEAVHHRDGPTLGRDRQLLAGGPVPVDYEVLAVRPVPGRPATATVRSRTSAPDGTVLTEEVVVVLAADEDGWRVYRVER